MQVYKVNTLKDYGTGSLRDGIKYANSNPKTKIKFDISGTIFLQNNLPKITNPTEILGNLSLSGTPTISIDGMGNLLVDLKMYKNV